MTSASDTQLLVILAKIPHPGLPDSPGCLSGRGGRSDVRGSSGRAKHGRGGAGVHVHVAPGAAPTPALSPEAAPGRPAAVTHPQALRAPQTPRQPGPRGQGQSQTEARTEIRRDQDRDRDGERPGQR